ncbi:Uncharacterised protein [Bordetella pertussis]|nr:Uncharacterised protein [Bordetella pertussis]CPM65566.1 Uncharacterised protein [Bordetella pertussis]
MMMTSFLLRSPMLAVPAHWSASSCRADWITSLTPVLASAAKPISSSWGVNDHNVPSLRT